MDAPTRRYLAFGHQNKKGDWYPTEDRADVESSDKQGWKGVLEWSYVGPRTPPTIRLAFWHALRSTPSGDPPPTLLRPSSPVLIDSLKDRPFCFSLTYPLFTFS